MLGNMVTSQPLESISEEVTGLAGDKKLLVQNVQKPSQEFKSIPEVTVNIPAKTGSSSALSEKLAASTPATPSSTTA